MRKGQKIRHIEGIERVKQKLLPVGEMEKEEVREENRGYVGITKKEIYKMISGYLDSEENNKSHEIS